MRIAYTVTAVFIQVCISYSSIYKCVFLTAAFTHVCVLLTAAYCLQLCLQVCISYSRVYKWYCLQLCLQVCISYSSVYKWYFLQQHLQVCITYSCVYKWYCLQLCLQVCICYSCVYTCILLTATYVFASVYLLQLFLVTAVFTGDIAYSCVYTCVLVTAVCISYRALCLQVCYFLNLLLLTELCVYKCVFLTDVFTCAHLYLSLLANCRSQLLLDCLGRCLKLFVSTDSTSSHEFASQFGPAIFYTRKTHKSYREDRVPRKCLLNASIDRQRQHERQQQRS